MPDRDILRQQAHDDCLHHAEALLNGEFLVELGDDEVAWSPVELRQIFTQPMVLWRRFGRIDVILDAENRPVGLVDETQWKDCAWEPLDPNVVIAIIHVPPLDLPRLVIERMEQGEKDCLEVWLRTVSESRPARWMARINPARLTLISIEPVEEADDRAGR